MNLQQLIERYIAYRYSLGEQFKGNASVLRVFGRSVGSHAEISDVRPEQVSAWLLGRGPVTRSWHHRYDALRGFYRYAISRGHIARSPLPTLLPQRPPPFVPYIYSREELRRLLDAAAGYQGRCSALEAVTMRTLVLLLYGAGLRLREAINLDRADVDPDNAVLTIRQTKFGKTRMVPFGPQLGCALTRYAARGPKGAAPEAPFFTTTPGARLKQRTVQGCFRRVCAGAGIRRLDGGRFQPRLHDLRHSAARRIMPTEARRSGSSGRLLYLLIGPLPDDAA